MTDIHHPNPESSRQCNIPHGSTSAKSTAEHEKINETTDQKSDIKSKDPFKSPPRIPFQCEICNMNELCDYKGTTPPFVNGLVFTEDCYVMRDPFASPPFRSRSKSEYFIVLGADCTMCSKIVCKRSKCSVFYQKTFCNSCALTNLSRFPSELQARFKKQLTA